MRRNAIKNHYGILMANCIVVRTKDFINVEYAASHRKKFHSAVEKDFVPMDAVIGHPAEIK